MSSRDHACADTCLLSEPVLVSSRSRHSDGHHAVVLVLVLVVLAQRTACLLAVLGLLRGASRGRFARVAASPVSIGIISAVTS